ncbi:4'-phosphopantetheinyl transferase superfamily protein [Jeongeupia wiesaeckerbachi]|uniref:4'-phosphopantetheinyl transferase superfamily protein n=1 Tax=Jeongeupia wiesaeckerbachi TaxID=3051218 RepID=UPI003D80323D
MRVALFDEVLAQLATGWRPDYGTPLLALRPVPGDRRAARSATRAAACALAACWAGSPKADYLRPGRRPRIAAGPMHFHVSLAYGNNGNNGSSEHTGGDREGCALIALCPADDHGIAALGIDLCAIGLLPDWDAVAGLYLPPAERQALHEATPSRRAEAFAQAWSRLEAGSKAAGIDLVEWHDGIAASFAGLRTSGLDMPPAFADHWAAMLACAPG